MLLPPSRWVPVGSCRRLAPLGGLLLAGALAACGSAAGAAPNGPATQSASNTARSSAQAPPRAAASAVRTPRPVSPPRGPAVHPVTPGAQWQVVATVGGRAAAWSTQNGGVTLLRFDQHATRLALHAGTIDPGSRGYTYGDEITGHELHQVIAAFNGGFKLNYGSVGFFADGHTPVALHGGLASIVTYRDGATDVGSWQAGVPARGRPIASVRQNLHLLVDRGLPASTTRTCGSPCWGATLGGGSTVARSALGVTGGGDLLWAAGVRLTPLGLAQAMTQAGVVRAAELDINPEWVAAYLYVHRRGGPAAIPFLGGQSGIPGRFLTPYGRDFFTVLAR